MDAFRPVCTRKILSAAQVKLNQDPLFYSSLFFFKFTYTVFILFWISFSAQMSTTCGIKILYNRRL